MVQGINTQNYSVAQLKELKNAGVQGISDEDIKAAQKREAESAKEIDDNEEVSYSIDDDASKENEAKKEVKTAESKGESLCNILETLIDKSTNKDSELADISKKLSEYELKMSDVMDETVELKSDTADNLNDVKSEAEDITKTIEEKQNEIKQKEAEIKSLQAEIDANPDDKGVEEKQGKIDALQGDITNLKADINSLNKGVSSKSKAEEMVKTAADVKLKLMGKSMDSVKGDLTDALNKATNSNEYADVTIEKGIEATETKPKDFINKGKNAKKKKRKVLLEML